VLYEAKSNGRNCTRTNISEVAVCA
jgi:hypothetical protein